MDRDSQLIYEQYLVEMPIQSVDVGDVSDPTDNKILRNPRAGEKILSLGDKIPYNLKIHIAGEGQHGAPPEAEEGIINVMLTAGMGDPMTKWMVGHRTGHALTMANKDASDRMYMYVVQTLFTYDVKYRSILDQGGMTEEMETALHTGDIDTVKEFDDFSDVGFYEKMSNFRSARTEQVLNIGEYIHELFAEYIVRGDLVVLDFANDGGKASDQFKQAMLGHITSLLDNSIGTVIKDDNVSADQDEYDGQKSGSTSDKRQDHNYRSDNRQVPPMPKSTHPGPRSTRIASSGSLAPAIGQHGGYEYMKDNFCRDKDSQLIYEAYLCEQITEKDIKPIIT